MRLTCDPPMSSAVLSGCGTYRYRLGRTWDPALPGACFVMLNPSTADARVDDPTIRRCVGFARNMGAGWLTVVNLFALRSTDPRALASHTDPIGPENDAHIVDAAGRATVVIAAWGADRFAPARAEAVRHLLAPRALHALGVTKDGAPRHPLYLRGDAELAPWPSSSRGSGRGFSDPVSRKPKRANGFEPSTFSLGSKTPTDQRSENVGNVGDLVDDGPGKGDRE